MASPIAITNDITLPTIPLLMAAHDYLGPPPVPPVPLTFMPGMSRASWGFEIPVPMFWPPGYALGQNKLADKVLHKGCPVVQDGHDCGALIVHVHYLPLPSNMLLVIQIPFSSRKSNMFSSTVQSQGKPTAWCALLMTTCWDPISPPATTAPTVLLNTVHFSLSLADIIAGIFIIAAGMAVDFICDKYFGGKDPAGWRDVAMAALSKVIPLNRRQLASWAAKQGLGLATGVARLFGDGPADFKIAVGAPGLQADAGFSRDANGNWSASESDRVGHVSTERKYDEGQGTTTTTTSDFNSTDTSETGKPTTSTEPLSLNPLRPGSWGSPL